MSQLPSGNAFLDQLMAFRGMYGNVAEPQNVPDLNFGEMGGAGQYFNNPLAVLGIQTGINWAFGRAGLMPSQFGPGRNLYDQYQDKGYWAARRAVLTRASEADRPTYVQTLRGIARMRGTPWGLEQQQAANVIAGDVAAMAPILAEWAPEEFDAAHGTRGSATVLARFLHRGGRFGVDPVTGRTGLGAASAADLAREIQSQYFRPGQDVSAWRGMRMGQAGALYEELQNRGMLGRSIGTYDPAEQLRLVTGTREGREGFVRRLMEEQPEEFRRLRDRAEAAQPGAVRAVRTLDPAGQVAELLRDRQTAAPVLEALRGQDPRLLDALRQQAGAPGGGVDAARVAANPQLLQAVVQAVRTAMPQAEIDRLVGVRADQQARAGLIANLPPDEQVRRLAGTDETARQGLEALRRLDPAAFNAAVDRFDRGRVEAERVAARPLPEQLRALARDPEAARAAVAEVRRRAPEEFDRLRREADRLRPGGSLAGLDPDEQVRRVAEAEHVTADAIRTIQQTQPGRFETMLRQVDAGAIARRVRDMAGAVGAMREIFGDMGRPNAPMTELIEGLNALTQGGLATMNPADMERMVRTTRVLARQTGMGLNAVVGMMAEGALDADRLGLSRAFVAPVQQRAMAFGAAYAQVGRGDLPAWGRLDREQLTLMDQQLRYRAAQSEAANQLGATMRIAEAQQNAGVALTPELQQLTRAIREGRTEFAPDPARPGETRSLLMNEGEWRAVMARQGVRTGVALQMLRAREENQRPVAQFGIQNTVRNLQPVEVREFMAGSFRTAALAALQDSGMDAAGASRAAERIGREQARALLDMPTEQRVDPRLRNRVLGDVARRVLADERADPAAAARFQGDMQAEAGWGNLGRAITRSPAFSGYRTPQGMLDAQSRAVLERERVLAEQANVTVQMQTAVAGLGQAGVTQRLMDMVQNPPEDLSRAVGEVFNGVDPQEVRRRLLGTAPQDAPGLAGVGARERMAVAMQEYVVTLQQFERARGDRNLTPEEQAAEMQNLNQRAEALRLGGPAATAQIRRELERAGVVRPGEDINPALQRLAREPDAFPQLGQATRDRVAALRAVGGGLDPAAARAESDRILRGLNLDPDQLTRVLAGEVDVPEEARARLRTLQGMGIGATAAEAGMAADVTVGPRQLDDARRQAALLAQDLGGDVARGLPADVKPARAAEARRHAGNAVERGRQTVDALLGSAETVRALGTGGFALARGVRDKQKEMALIARELGVGEADVLTRGDRKDERVRKFLALHGEVQEGLGALSARLAEPGRRAAADPRELADYAAYAAEEAKGDDARNLAAVERALGGDVTAPLASAEQRQEAARLLGTGVEGEYRRRQLNLALGARARLADVARAHGTDITGLRALSLAGGTGLGAAEGAAVTRDLGAAGALGEGVGPENLRQFLDALGKPPGPAGDPARPQEITLSGTLDLSNGKMAARGEAVTPLGATPAVA